MPYETFWHLNPKKLKSFAEAEKIKEKMRDKAAWRSGMYTYISLIKVAPILQAFAKRGTKPGEYPSKPLYFDQEMKEAEEEVKRGEMTEEEFLQTPEMIKKAELVLKQLELMQRADEIERLNRKYEERLKSNE